MAGARSYERLPVEEFGRQLLASRDLDPVYCALHDLKRHWGVSRVARWMVAYWCYYHCGAASYLSDFVGARFWSEMMRAAENKEPAPTDGRWPRGSERRHFRGQQAIRSVEELATRYGDRPEEMVIYVAGSAVEPWGKLTTESNPFEAVAKRVREHRGFGPWISFKVGDMLERVLGTPVDFSEAAVFMFKDPVKAALMVWRDKMRLPENAKPKDTAAAIHGVVEHLLGEFDGTTAPPNGDRLVGLQEVETVLCKWKSHVNGHYPLYNDIDEINEGLTAWVGVTDAAREFQDAMPRRQGCYEEVVRIK